MYCDKSKYSIKNYDKSNYEDLKFLREICMETMKEKYIGGLHYLVEGCENFVKILLYNDERIGIGIVSKDYRKNFYEIRYIVLNSKRKMGIGTILMEKLIEFVKTGIRDSEGIILVIDEANVASIALKSKFGFQTNEENSSEHILITKVK